MMLTFRTRGGLAAEFALSDSLDFGSCATGTSRVTGSEEQCRHAAHTLKLDFSLVHNSTVAGGGR